MDPFHDPADDREGPPLELAVDPAQARRQMQVTTPRRPPFDPSAALAPSEEHGMSAPLALSLGPLFRAEHLEIRQVRERLEAWTGWETRNRYDVRAPGGTIFLEVAEEGEGWLHALSRNFNPFRRIGVEMMTLGGSRAMRLERPWTFWLTRADVFGWDGAKLGTLEQRFTLLRRALVVRSAEGSVLAEIEGPFFRPWTFLVQRDGAEVGSIVKRWGGVLREMFTDADNFAVRFSPALTCPTTRQLLLAAAILIDMTWFENRRRRRGGVWGLLSE
jgi:hypothetical protein